MTLTQALERVSRAYVSGVAPYYSALKPDPWQAAHDELERIAGRFDQAIVSPACERFVSRCIELIQRFKQDHGATKSVTPSDAFMMNPEAVSNHFSRKLQRCAKCYSKENLKIVPIGPDSMEVKLLCNQCRGSA